MSNTFVFPVVSRPTIDFITQLNPAAGSLVAPFVGSPVFNIPGLPNCSSRRYLIRAIGWVCPQNVGLEFDFFGSAAGLTDAILTDTFLSRFQFTSANGAQFNSGALFRYYVDGLAIPYVDLDTINTTTPPTLHVAIQNVDTVSKSVAPAGGVAATFYVEPVQAW